MSPDHAPPSLPFKVLVVDDTSVNRMILARYIQHMGYPVIQAENGLQALEKYQAEHPDIILMDVMMPGMDGFETTRRIRAMEGDNWVPIVFISALSEDRNLTEGLAAGGDDYLHKPVNFTVLQAKLQSLSRTLVLHRRLTEERQRAQAVADNIPEGLIVIDEASRIRSCNPKALNIFGYTQEELIGRNVSMLMPEPYHSAHDGYVESYVSGGAPRIIGVSQREVLGLRKDGQVFPLELAVTEVRMDGQRNFLGILRDISARKAAENQLKDNAARLQAYHDAQEEENALARDLMLRQMLRRGLTADHVRHWLSPASHFSGDIVAAAEGPDGLVYGILADATGHGLGAAVTVMPLLTVFHTLAQAGADIQHLLLAANRELRASLPTGRFVGVSLVRLDPRRGQAEVWVGGTPEVLLFGQDGRRLGCFPSRHLSLGILDMDAAEATPEQVALSPGCQFALYSDGLIEAMDAAGEAFGDARLAAVLAGHAPADRLEALRAALRAHLGGDTGQDDMSILLLDCPDTP